MKAALFALAMLAAPVVALADPGGGRGGGSDKTVQAPEIDPTAITGPLVLLATGTLILTDRFRRKRPC
jgi:hypothetical protein